LGASLWRQKSRSKRGKGGQGQDVNILTQIGFVVLVVSAISLPQ